MDIMNLKTTEVNHISQTPETESRYTAAQKEKLAKTSKDFESLLTSMMMKSMTQTTEGMFGEDSYGGDVLDTMFESEMATYMTKSKDLGVAKMLYKKITGEDLPSVIEKASSSNSGKALDPIEINNSGSNSKVTPSEASIKRINQYDDIINQAAEAYGVDANVIKSVIMAESAGNSKAVSGAKAKGLMQLIDSTASDMGVKNVWDPKENIFGGTKYLSGLLRQYNGDLKLALAGYNAGPANVTKYNGVPPFDETKKYITRVVGYLKHFDS
jgi:Rod binding domain-containing protein